MDLQTKRIHWTTGTHVQYALGGRDRSFLFLLILLYILGFGECIVYLFISFYKLFCFCFFFVFVKTPLLCSPILNK